ncbi:hypothetical protein LCGC14_1302780 [marine sediment metagenome]|uniref:Uncharacterized protein n=1 Tax=marine sediment metagenome TaxID=412755 RepID=A0A0F9N5Q7_9ZZZZ
MTLKEVGIVIGKKLVTSSTTVRRSLVYVSFEGTEIKDKSLLLGAFGQGHTVGQAKADYCRKLRGEILVTDAQWSTRNETQLPPRITVR